MAESCEGMLPVKRLLSKANRTRLIKVESCFGMLPMNLLVPKLNRVRAVSVENCAEIVPVILLVPKLRACNLVRAEIVTGRDPVRAFASISIFVRPLRPPIAGSNVLTREDEGRMIAETAPFVQVIPCHVPSHGGLLPGQLSELGLPHVLYIATRLE